MEADSSHPRVIISPDLPFRGFDRRAHTPWQMVPVGGQRSLRIQKEAGLTAKVRDPQYLQMEERGDLVFLKGLKEGSTRIEWWQPPSSGFRKVVFQLEVCIKIKRDIRTAFFYVDDGRLQKTMRKPVDNFSLICQANNILTPQTNASFVSVSAVHLKIKKDLGKVVRYSKNIEGVRKRQHEWDDLKKFVKTSADLNVFFVQELEADDTPYEDETAGVAVYKDKMCIVEDIPDLYRSAWVLVHEAGHVIGNLRDINYGLMGPPNRIMGRIEPYYTSIFISAGMINRFNPSGTK